MTPAVDALASAGIAYELFEYEHSPDVESYGLEAAEALGVEPESVFKTLVADVVGIGLVVAIVPVTVMLDLKGLARASGGKKAAMADVSAAERSSGYVAGGISPFGQKRPLPTFIDETCGVWDRIYVSAGRRGLDLSVAPDDLVGLVDATKAPIAVW